MRFACESAASGRAATLAADVRATIPVLETARLILRAPQLADFDSYAAIVTSPRGAFLGSASREEAWYDFTQMVAGWVLRGHGLWSVQSRDNGALLGFVLLGFEPEDPEPELGYVFLPEAEGRGLACEAARAGRDFAFDVLGWATLVSFIDPANTRSIALATRLGAFRDGQIDSTEDHSKTLVFRHPSTKRRLT